MWVARPAAAVLLFAAKGIIQSFYAAFVKILRSLVVVVAAAAFILFAYVRPGFAMLLWNSLKVTEKQAIRPVALASTVFWSLHCGGKRI